MYINYFVENETLNQKIIYLIANNPNIKNIDKINDIHLSKNSLIIRFNNDPYNLINKIFINKCDIMFLRCNKDWLFNNFNDKNKDNFKNKVFTYLTYKKVNGNSTFNDNEINPQLKKTLDKLKLKKYYISELSTKNWEPSSPTLGFAILENILKNINYQKIILIGFTNLTKPNVKKGEKYGCHSLYNENQYFQNHIMKNYPNIETID